mmetsp:Transcript_41431/g.74313  ORF Transcript_41431/g.74313 Transcript_41431/m.74313 type:complete len:93 (-) Transcript_41431:465-743(-)
MSASPTITSSPTPPATRVIQAQGSGVMLKEDVRKKNFRPKVEELTGDKQMPRKPRTMHHTLPEPQREGVLAPQAKPHPPTLVPYPNRFAEWH